MKFRIVFLDENDEKQNLITIKFYHLSNGVMTLYDDNDEFLVCFPVTRFIICERVI